MIERLETIEKHYNDLSAELANEETLKDVNKTKKISKELSDLEETVSCFNAYKKVLEEIEQAKEILDDPDLKDMAKEELDAKEVQKADLEK